MLLLYPWKAGYVLKSTKISGYQKKSRLQLIKAIEECTSLSQLFALIQHENISLQMHTQSGASGIKPKKLTANEIINKNESPFERLKAEIIKAVEENSYNSWTYWLINIIKVY